MPIDNTPRFNLAMAGISASDISRALLHSGLSWKMHPAQLFALETRAFNNSTTVETTEYALDKTEETRELVPERYTHNITLFGLPVEVDRLYSYHSIGLYHGDKLIYSIDAIGVPIGF